MSVYRLCVGLLALLLWLMCLCSIGALIEGVQDVPGYFFFSVFCGICAKTVSEHFMKEDDDESF